MLVSDILFNAPRMRYSREQRLGNIEWARALGAKPPTSHSLEKFQDQMLERVGDPTRKITSRSGNVFYMNSVMESIRKVPFGLCLWDE
ncbi:hypothetical protein SISNIDRAFT_421047 [Sistotremastrum niveocremeum HHB9708]|uniref:Uncharacterized protein n=1 Tax=Sistotremastrum niveocremeum HHB9708 TaxID=1314777 RepID=A0A164M489_9AGAM|nr:hypothetical protein SISNIDRAFT_421047 [Sistotremastrum niveocremeum HHB9708]